MSMTAAHRKTPTCFGQLEIVFPEGEDGLRSSPSACLGCMHKTACLSAAMKAEEGLKVREAVIDRAYAAGMVGFFERWSKKKEIQRKIKDKRRDSSTSGGCHENN